MYPFPANGRQALSVAESLLEEVSLMPFTLRDGGDGSSALGFYQLRANACNAPSSGACPNSTANPGNTCAERQLASIVVR